MTAFVTLREVDDAPDVVGVGVCFCFSFAFSFFCFCCCRCLMLLLPVFDDATNSFDIVCLLSVGS